VAQIVTAMYTDTCSLPCDDPLENPDRTQKVGHNYLLSPVLGDHKNT